MRHLAILVIIAFFVTSIKGPVYAQLPQNLPLERNLVHLSPTFTPAHLKGIVIDPHNAFKFDFIIHKGDKALEEGSKKKEYTKLIKYFMASLAVPDEDQWVNLSPYEKDRIIKEDFGKTEMGRDLLAQDYLLKQITASLIYPQDKLGQKFWNEVYKRAYEQFGTTNIPVNTFNKVWITPDKADIYEKGNTAYVYNSHLKVMLEEDYWLLEKHTGVIASAAKQSFKKIAASPSAPRNDTGQLGSQIIREIILPALEKEINEGENFAMLRQIYSGMILAAWYKRALKESLLGKIYANQTKIKGIDQDPKNNERIYQQYLKAFKKGVFSIIKEDVDQHSHKVIPRKYFSGGFAPNMDRAMHHHQANDPQAIKAVREDYVDGLRIDLAQVIVEEPDAAMKVSRSTMITAIVSAIAVLFITGYIRHNNSKVKDWRTSQNKVAMNAIEQSYGKKDPIELLRLAEKAMKEGNKTAEAHARLKHNELSDDSSVRIAGKTPGSWQTRLIEAQAQAGQSQDVGEFAATLSALAGELEEEKKIDLDYQERVRDFSKDVPLVLSGEMGADLDEMKKVLEAYENLEINTEEDLHEKFDLELHDLAKEILLNNRPEFKQRLEMLNWLEVTLGRKMSTIDEMSQKAKREFGSEWSNNVVEDLEKEIKGITDFIQDKIKNERSWIEEQIRMFIDQDKKKYLDSQPIESAGTKGDEGMNSKKVNNLGGIDFNASNLNLQIKRDGQGVPLPINQQNLQNIHIEGLVPQILKIIPAVNSPLSSELLS